MKEKLIAAGVHVLVVRDEPKSETGKFTVPDIAKKKPSTGFILSVGAEIDDPAIKVGNKALFAVGNGFEIMLENDETIVVLTKHQVIAGYDPNNQ